MITSIDPIDNWFMQRWSKFTASETYKLLTPSKANEFWSLGAKTYIEEKAMQVVTEMQERPEMEEVKSLLWGKSHEYPAYEAYVYETKNYSMTYMGTDQPIFLEYEPLKEESGGTPDVANISKDFVIDAGAEIKCPKNSIEHFRRLRWSTQWDVKEGYPLVYCQIQHLLMITGASVWHFVSFDDRQIMRSKKTKIIEVLPDKKFMDNLHVRLELAIKKKYEILSEHMDTEVKCKKDFLKLVK